MGSVADRWRLKVLTAGAAVLLGVVFLAGIAYASDNLITNGDFEVPDAGSTFVTYFAGETIGGWSVESGSVDHGPWNLALLII